MRRPADPGGRQSWSSRSGMRSRCAAGGRWRCRPGTGLSANRRRSLRRSAGSGRWSATAARAPAGGSHRLALRAAARNAHRGSGRGRSRTTRSRIASGSSRSGRPCPHRARSPGPPGCRPHPMRRWRCCTTSRSWRSGRRRPRRDRCARARTSAARARRRAALAGPGRPWCCTSHAVRSPDTDRCRVAGRRGSPAPPGRQPPSVPQPS